MPLLVNLDELKEGDVTLAGALPAAELDLDTRDALIRPGDTLDYRVTVSRAEDDLVLRGRLAMEFACDCVRCLDPFTLPLALEDWLAHGELAGEDALPRVGEDVDLTRLAREDILLGLPQHPLCDPGCCGLPPPGGEPPAAAPPSDASTSAWAQLDRGTRD